MKEKKGVLFYSQEKWDKNVSSGGAQKCYRNYKFKSQIGPCEYSGPSIVVQLFHSTSKVNCGSESCVDFLKVKQCIISQSYPEK